MFRPIVELQPDIIALGHDQSFDEQRLVEKLRGRGLNTKVTRIEAEEECRYCSSTRIIREVADVAQRRVKEYEKRELEKIKKTV